jgi:hypothetical protein
MTDYLLKALKAIQADTDLTALSIQLQQAINIKRLDIRQRENLERLLAIEFNQPV